jgi:CRP/FNR family cyclic AMP-dependent transcriptional regulator
MMQTAMSDAWSLHGERGFSEDFVEPEIRRSSILSQKAREQRAQGPFLLLGVMTASDVEWMLEHGFQQKVPAGTVLINEGARFAHLFVIMEGMFRVSLNGRDDKELATLGPCEVLGEISFVDFRPSSATVTALEDSMVLALTRQQLIRQFKRDLDFAVRFYRTLSIFLADRVRKNALR